MTSVQVNFLCAVFLCGPGAGLPTYGVLRRDLKCQEEAAFYDDKYEAVPETSPSGNLQTDIQGKIQVCVQFNFSIHWFPNK